MYIVKTLPEFDSWLDGIKDRVTRLRLARLLDMSSLAEDSAVAITRANQLED